MNEYNGYKYSTGTTISGFLSEGYDEGGSIVYGFGTDEESSVDDMMRRIDEYDFFFTDFDI